MPGAGFDGAAALPRTPVATICTASDVAQLLNLTAAAPFHAAPGSPGGMDLVFDAFDELFYVAPQMRQRWLEGSWDLLEVALSTATNDDRRELGLNALAVSDRHRRGLAVDLRAVRRIVHIALATRVVHTRIHTQQHELRTVLAATALLTRPSSAADEAPATWFTRVARALRGGLICVPDHPTVDEDPALWRAELALAESASAVQYAIAVRLCAAALRRRLDPDHWDQSESILMAAAQQMWQVDAIERFADLIGLTPIR